MDAFQSGEKTREATLRYLKVINDWDVFDLHLVRILCGMVGLASKRKGSNSVSRMGKALLADGAAREPVPARR